MLQLWLVANTVLWPISVKLGGLTLGLNVVVLILTGAVWLGKSWRISAGSAKVLFALLLFVPFSLIVALAGPCTDHLQKSLLSIPILFFLILLALEVGRRSSSTDWLSLHKTALWCLIVAFCGFIVEMLFPSRFAFQIIYREDGKFSGLFQEPSHVAFSLFPCIAVLLSAEDKKIQLRGFLALLGLLLFSRSSTLIALIAVYVLYRLFSQGKVRQAAALTLGIGALIALAATIDYSRFVLPTVARITGIATPDQTDNLSSLVYVQGWQDAWFNIRRTHGMGLGINMMGCTPLPDVSVRTVLALGGLGDINAEDGSFLFSKIVSETGVLGILFYILLIWWWIQLERRLRRARKDAIYHAVSVQAIFIFCFVACSFLRSANYFNGGFLFWVVTGAAASTWQPHLSTAPLAIEEACAPIS